MDGYLRLLWQGITIVLVFLTLLSTQQYVVEIRVQYEHIAG